MYTNTNYLQAYADMDAAAAAWVGARLQLAAVEEEASDDLPGALLASLLEEVGQFGCCAWLGYVLRRRECDPAWPQV